MLLTEEKFEQVNAIFEGEGDSKRTFLQGIFSESESKNKNRRVYSRNDIKLASDMINESAQSGRHILGELDHPKNTEIRLENVSHRLVESNMDGNNAYCKIEILEKHPKGAIAKSLIDSGVQLGVSTRGSGSVNESTGQVKNYQFKTIDLVATPSSPNAYPKTIREQLEEYSRSGELNMLSEAIMHDPIARLYFKREMKKFMEGLRKK